METSEKRIKRKFDHALTIDEKKELQRERYKKWYNKHKNDPEFIEKKRERSKQYRLAQKEELKKLREQFKLN